MDIPSTVTLIDELAFENCTSLVYLDVKTSQLVKDYFLPNITDTWYFNGEVDINKNIDHYNSIGLYSSQAVDSISAASDWEVQVIDGKNYIVAYLGDRTLSEITIPSTLIDNGNNLTSIYGVCSKTNTDLFVETNIQNVQVGLSIKHIAANTFKNSEIQTISFRSLLENIGDFAFYNCQQLTSVILSGTSVTTIGKSAFENCTRLTSLRLPDTITTIGEKAFKNCSSIGSAIDLTRSSLTTLGKEAFYGNTNLTSIIFSSTITTINERTFTDCANLRTIIIPSNITTIKEESFKGCTSLNTVTLNSSLTTIGHSVFEGCTALSKINSQTVGEIDLSSLSSLTTLSEYLFKDCTSIQKVLINTNVTTMGISLFEGCTRLVNINSSEGVLDLSDLTNVTSLSDNILKDCSTATNIILPSSLTTIGTNTLNGCSSLVNLTIPFIGVSKTDNETTTSVLGYYFGTNSYTNGISVAQVYTENTRISYQIPSALSSVTVTNANFIPYGAFSYLTKVTTVTVSVATDIKENAFYYATGTQNSTGLTSVTLNGVVTIRESAFEGCTDLVTVQIDESTIENIKSKAFIDCSSLVKINSNVLNTFNFGNCSSLEIIENDVFKNCVGLHSISLPASVQTLGASAFENCINLTTVTGLQSTQITVIANELFKNCRSLVNFTLPTTLTTVIEVSAFEGCSSITTVNNLGNTYINSIQQAAFKGCTSLLSLTLPNTISLLGISAFENCTSLQTIANTQSVCYIQDNAFSNCGDLTSFDFYSVQTIGDYAFKNCTDLQNIQFTTESLLQIGTYAFQNCNLQEKIIFPSTLRTIKEDAFYGCLNLIYIVFNSSVNTTEGAPIFRLPYVYDKNFSINNSINQLGWCRNGVYLGEYSAITQPGVYSYYGLYSIDELSYSSLWEISNEGEDELTTVPYYIVKYLGSDTSVKIPKLIRRNLGDLIFVRTIGNGSESIFDDSIASAITKVDTSRRLYSIDEHVFENCTNLETVYLANEITTLSEDLFVNNTKLKYISTYATTIPQGV